MHESAEELSQKKKQEKDLVNKRLGIEATITAERNRKLRKQRDSLLAEVSTLDEELTQKRKRYDILCEQRKQVLELRTPGGRRRKATGDERTEAASPPSACG